MNPAAGYDKRIVYFMYTNPAAYPPLERSTRLLADDGWNVLVLGLMRPDTQALRFPPHPRITLRYALDASSGWRLRLHYVWFAAWVLCWTLRWRARWVYASDLLSCPIALVLGLVPGLRILYHEHDEPALRRGPIAWAQRTIRRLLGRRADLRVLPNAERARFFEHTISSGKPVMQVWNCPSITEVARPRTPATAAADVGAVVRVVYSGSVTPERLPIAFLEAMASMRGRLRLRVVGYTTIGFPHYLEQLRRTARELDIDEDVELVGVLPRHRLQEVWDEADVGLALNPMEFPNNNRPVDDWRLEQALRLHGERPRVAHLGSTRVAPGVRAAGLRGCRRPTRLPQSDHRAALAGRTSRRDPRDGRARPATNRSPLELRISVRARHRTSRRHLASRSLTPHRTA